MTNYGVALWFAILSVSPAICHEHADGDADHSHGYGLFSLSPRLAATCSPESEFAPHARHYHMVVFGIEITILPGCAALETGIVPDQCAVGIALYTDLGANPVTDNTATDSTLLDSPTNALIVEHVASPELPPTGPPSPPCVPPRALRSRIQLI